MLTKHLAKSAGKNQKAGRSGRVLMSNEARVLRDLRIQSGLSMRKAGLLLGCSDSYISHIENGRTDIPKGKKLENFLTIYGGIKPKSFYERVRKFSETISPHDELRYLIEPLPDEKINTIIKIIRSLL